MSEETQEPLPAVEPTAPAGETSGDPEWDEAVAAVAEINPPAEAPAVPVADAPVETPEPVDSDFSRVQLQNGEIEYKLATGQVYRGKSDAEVAGKIAKAQFEASRTIQQLRAAPPAPAAPTPPEQNPESPQFSPEALAIADYAAQGLGFKNSAEMREAIGQFRASSESMQTAAQVQAEQAAAVSFMRQTPDFVATEANADKIVGRLIELNLPFTPEYAGLVFSELKAKGEFEAAPAATPKDPATGRFTSKMPVPPSGASATPAADAMTAEKFYTLDTQAMEEWLNKQYAQA